MVLSTIPAMARREVGMALFIAMELAWVAVLYDLVQSVIGLGDEVPLAWVTALYPATYLFLRVERRWWLPPAWTIAVRTVLGSVAVISAVAVMAWPDFLEALAAPGSYDWMEFITRAPSFPTLVMVGASFAVLRGGLLGARQVDSRGFLTGFQLGIGVLFVIVFGQHLAGFPETEVVPGMMAFFAFGLYGLGANRWLRSDASAKTAGQAGWPLLGLGIIALILAVGALFWTQFDARTVDLLLVPVFWLWDLFARIFFFLLSLLPKAEIASMPETPQPMALPHGGAAREISWGDTVRTVSRVIFNTTLAIILAWALLRNLVDLLRWLSRRLDRSEGIVYERSSYGMFGDLRDLFIALGQLVLAIWFRILSPFRGTRAESLPPEVRAVRTLYRRLLVWAAKRGWPKQAGQTPYEFLDFLKSSIPHLESDLVFLTDSYVAVRYGAARPEPETLRGLRASWRRVRKAKKTKKRTSSR